MPIFFFALLFSFFTPSVVKYQVGGSTTVYVNVHLRSASASRLRTTANRVTGGGRVSSIPLRPSAYFAGGGVPRKKHFFKWGAERRPASSPCPAPEKSARNGELPPSPLPPHSSPLEHFGVVGHGAFFEVKGVFPSGARGRRPASVPPPRRTVVGWERNPSSFSRSRPRVVG